MAKGNLPNNKTAAGDPQGRPGDGGHRRPRPRRSWFVPTAPGWGSVEKAQVLQTMLQDIATGKKSVEARREGRGRRDRQGHQHQELSAGPRSERALPPYDQGPLRST